MDRRLLSNAMNRLAAVLCDCCMAHLRCGLTGWRCQCRFLRTADADGGHRALRHRHEHRPRPGWHRLLLRLRPAGAAAAAYWSGMPGPGHGRLLPEPAAAGRQPAPAAALVARRLRLPVVVRRLPRWRLPLDRTGRSWDPSQRMIRTARLVGLPS